MRFLRQFEGVGWVVATGSYLALLAASAGAFGRHLAVPPSLQAGEPEPIKIGLVTALNGDLRPWGQDCRDGVQLAVDRFNKRGGLHGRKVELLVEDSNSRPEQGQSAADKLYSEGCIAILGEVASGISTAMRELTTKKKIPQIAVAATRDDLADGTKYLFRVCYTDKVQGPAMAKFAYQQLHLRRMAIMSDAMQPYSVNLSQSFRAYFRKLGGRIADEEQFNTGQTFFGKILAKVKARNPDGVFCSGYFTEAGPIARQAREMGIDKHIPFLGGDGWDSREILSTGGDAIIGSFFSNHYVNSDPSPRVKAFLRAWSDAHAGAVPATTCGALGFDAAGLVLDALKRAKTPTSPDLRNAIDLAVGYPGVTGRITLKGRHGNPPKRVVVVRLTDDPQAAQSFAWAYEYADIFSRRTYRKARQH